MARTRAEDFEEKQRTLLLEAARVFASQGMEKASMAQIANQAGVSKSLLYHYYQSKDELIFEIISRHHNDLDVILGEIDDVNQPPEVRLETFIAATLEYYRGALDQHWVALNSRSALDKVKLAEILAVERRIFKRFAGLICQINPNLGQGDPPLLTPATMSLFAMLNYLNIWFNEPGHLSRRDYAALITKLLLGGVVSLA